MTAGQHLLGRGPELARLGALLEDARNGRQQIALVGGDAGIGKTSLVATFAETAVESGMGAIWGRCWEGGGAAPFWPWIQVLRSCLEQVGDETLAALAPEMADVAQLVPELRTRMPGLAEPAQSDGPGARLRLFDSVAAIIAAVAKEGTGLVVVLEDVHAADDGSLQLLTSLGRRAAPVPLVLVATYRTTELVRSEVLTLTVDALGRSGPRLELRGLATEEVGLLLKRAGPDVGKVDLGRVHDATDGNPFLVHEAARLLAAAAPDRRADVVLPADARSLINRRLEPVPPEQRSVLAAGAVLGREFELGLLAQVLDRPAVDLIDLLSDAVGLAVVEELQLGRWSFTHALLREALVDQLETTERARLHQRAGEVLQSIHGETDGGVVARIAAHLHAALAGGGGDVAHAVAFCTRAARAASATLAYEEAGRWYDRALDALDLMEPPDEFRRYELLVAAAEVATRYGNVRATVAAHQRAIRAARAMGSVELAARAAVLAAPMGVSDPLVIGALDDGLCDLPEEDSPLRARVLVSFARVLSASFLARDVLLDVSRQGLEMARRINDPETSWWTLWQWHQNALGSPKTLAERHRVAGELFEIADQSSDLERRQLARRWRASNLMEEGDLAGARAELETGMSEAEELRQPFHLWYATVGLANVATAEGRLDESERLARQAAALGEDLEFLNAEVTFGAHLLMIRRHQGAFEELGRMALDALESWTVAGWDCGRELPLLLSYIHGDHLAEARARFDKVLGTGIEKLYVITDPEGNRMEVTDGPGCCWAGVAELSWLLGDRERAAPLYERMPRQGAHIVSSDGSSRGAKDRYLGQMATLLGHFGEAEAHFEAAHRLHERMGTPIWGAHGRADHARMLELRNGPGDRALAAELLTTAAETFGGLGMEYYEQQARQRLGSLAATGTLLAMRREGESWAITFQGVDMRAADSKGVRYLARLVATPGQELHALDLVVGDGRRTATGAGELAADGGGDAGTLLDPQAKVAYRRRLEELRDAGGDADDVRQEIAFLERELGAAAGLGGRDRRVATDAERARQSVTKAIKDAVDRLGDVDRGLGRHLRAAVRTGVYSSYAPE